MKIDLSLYLVTDRTLSQGRDIVDIVRQAVAAGVSCVQLREKHLGTRDFIAQARDVSAVLAGSGVPLIINDRVDVALAVQASGVHLGQSDMRLPAAREILGPSRLIGISAETVVQAIQAQAEGADYVGISPVFATQTKTDTATPLGLDGIRAIRKAVSLPLVGIGGIGAANAAAVIQAGCDGVAVVSAIVAATCPASAARELCGIIQTAKGKI